MAAACRSKGAKMGLYRFEGQMPDNTDCGTSCEKVGRGNYDDSRWQRVFVKLTNASGVLSAAAGQTVEAFKYGMGEDATGAGYPISGSSPILFSADDTNVHKNNGLHGVTLLACGVALGDPCTLTASASGGFTVLTVGEDAAQDGYRATILRRVSEYFRVDLVRCADESADEGQSRTFGLGSILRNADHRGSYRDLETPNVGGFPGMPLALARRFDIPVAKSNERPFKVQLVNKRALSIPARSSAVSADIYVPVMISFVTEPLAA
jgi:hypothetical protein